MTENFRVFCDKLELKVKKLYEASLTLEEAEKLAAEFLHAQMIVSTELRHADLDSRMRKQGVKTLRAAIYKDEVTKTEKKPTEAMLTALIDSNSLVVEEQTRYDEADVETAEIERLYNIFREAHIFLRGVAKGNL